MLAYTIQKTCTVFAVPIQSIRVSRWKSNGTMKTKRSKTNRTEIKCFVWVVMLMATMVVVVVMVHKDKVALLFSICFIKSLFFHPLYVCVCEFEGIHERRDSIWNWTISSDVQNHWYILYDEHKIHRRLLFMKYTQNSAVSRTVSVSLSDVLHRVFPDFSGEYFLRSHVTELEKECVLCDCIEPASRVDDAESSFITK